MCITSDVQARKELEAEFQRARIEADRALEEHKKKEEAALLAAKVCLCQYVCDCRCVAIVCLCTLVRVCVFVRRLVACYYTRACNLGPHSVAHMDSSLHLCMYVQVDAERRARAAAALEAEILAKQERARQAELEVMSRTTTRTHRTPDRCCTEPHTTRGRWRGCAISSACAALCPCDGSVV